MPQGSSPRQGRRPLGRARAGWLLVPGLLGRLGLAGGVAPAGAAGVVAPVQLATEPADYVQPGTQPAPQLNNFLPGSLCRSCHGDYSDGDEEPYDSWAASMMAQSARDPVWRAAVAVANGDAAGAGETCIRCHAPVGWLGTRSSGGDPAQLERDDLDGVNCHFCHRMVDPILGADSPAEDADVLAALGAEVRPPGTCVDAAGRRCTADAECGTPGSCRIEAGQGRFVVDRADARRGPFEIGFALHPTIFSPFHRRSEACAPCHDVSTPTYTREGDAYLPNAFGEPHPTQRPEDMFPEQRTFSEWRTSQFARGGVVFPDGRFGGRLTAARPNAVPVSTCQDCHMPDAQAPGCDVFPARPDMPAHFFAGANTWVLGAVLDEFGAESGLTAAAVERAAGRTEQMLRDAADVELTQRGRVLTVRVVNQTGHKLPTGYPEGRRMWVNVRFFAGASAAPIAEDGRYDFDAAELDAAHTTKVYAVRHEIDERASALTGLPPGTGFHLALSNRIALDNRIPPRGFTNAAYAEIGAAPVGHAYADGQYWDDTEYAVPAGATRVEVRLYYQTTTREYAEFLRTAASGGSGERAYAAWLARGMSRPVEMDRQPLALEARCEPGVVCADDGDPCTEERCDPIGACLHSPVVCRDDGNPCTDDVCDPRAGTCGVARDASCDDANACTVSDACRGGTCQGSPRGCDDGDPCTIDACDPAAGCRHVPLGFTTLGEALAGALTVEPCVGQRVPRRVERLLDAARRLVTRAERTRRPARAKAKVKRALDRLEQGERALARAGRRIEPACAASLAGRFAAARAAARCLVLVL
jgi:hypothetical protein